MRIRTSVSLITLALALISGQAFAVGNTDTEKALVDALRLKPGTNERVDSPRAAIQAYKHAGVIEKMPTQRADYTDYYVLKNRKRFMGHELVVIENEYMGNYAGCCVSPGAGVSVKVIGDTSNLEIFAHRNKCTLSKEFDVRKQLNDIGISTMLPPASYANLSCRERDADR